MGIRFTGDIHGHYNEYLKIVQDAEEKGLNTVQVGDFGFSYTCLSSVNSDQHKFLGGNHDFYPILLNAPPPHYLGNFGVHKFPNESEFFYVRGAFSIDKAYRIEGVDWFASEELTVKQALEALKLYKKTKPELVISHDFPSEIVADICGRMYVIENRTSQLLQAMFEAHQPKLWVGGHHHLHYQKQLRGTTFICIPELAFLDFHGILE